MQAQRYGYTQMVNNAILTNASYKLRFAQDITLYLSEIALDITGFDEKAGKKHWLEDPIWQPTRRSVESIMGSTDYLEQYFATNVVFEPLVGELFRSGLHHAGRGFAERLHHPRDRVGRRSRLRAEPRQYGGALPSPRHGSDAWRPKYRAVQRLALDKHGVLALDAANNLQPIWSQPRVKIAGFADALAHAKNRIKGIATEIGLSVPSALAS